MGPVLVMNTIAVNFATFNLLKSTIENAYRVYVIFGIFFARKFNLEYESEVSFFKFCL